ncbi:MAG: hypothetical protein A2089_14435 [Elusimicrobia bacterium GWD2_63_28]|nr:MAG: hypothetical protein A2089_14435 [Elusimicrobia bacterium GWD2_63_28]
MMPAKERKRYIILGWDSSSAQAAKSLAAMGMEVVVVSDTAPERLEPDVHFVPGAPTEQATLISAGVEHAHTLLLALPADEARRAIAVAKRLNPAINIVASLQGDDPEIALWAAGAGSVIDSGKEAGREMVRLMLEPGNAAQEDDDRIYYSRIPVNPGSPWAGLRLADLRGKLSCVSVAAILPGANPSAARENDDATAAEGDSLLVLGTKSQLTTLSRTADGENT